MRYTIFLIVVAFSFLIINIANSEPSFNGNTPGCGGSGCHTMASGIVTAEVLSNFQVRVTVSGTTSDVGGELVDTSGTVVAVNNSTSSNPFTLTAPAAGTYIVNAGYRSPSRDWGTTTVTIAVTGIDDKLIGNNPQAYQLYSNYPNPFNPTTKIRYSLPQPGFTTLKIYNIQGKEVLTLVKGEKPAGIYEVSFDAANLPSGNYVYQLKSGSYVETRKMALIK